MSELPVGTQGHKEGGYWYYKRGEYMVYEDSCSFTAVRLEFDGPGISDAVDVIDQLATLAFHSEESEAMVKQLIEAANALIPFVPVTAETDRYIQRIDDLTKNWQER